MEIKRPDSQNDENSLMVPKLMGAAATVLSLFDDPRRKGVVDTPARYAKAMVEMMDRPELKLSVFDADGYDNMIVDTNIPFYSFCEHHLLPFFGYATVGYIPDKKVIGLSKLARIVKYHAAGFQMQERLTSEIAQQIQDAVTPLGVGVILRGRHLCREMRGIAVAGAEMVTSCLLGNFKDENKVRGEFLRFLK